MSQNKPKSSPKPKANAKPKDPAKKSPQKVLKAFTQRGPGNKVTKQEIKKAIAKTGVSAQKALNINKNSNKVKLDKGAKKYLKGLLGKSAPGSEQGPGQGPDTIGTGVFQDDGTGIFGPISAHEKDIANIYADADKYIADAYSGAQIRGAELGLEGTKYAADKESEWRQAVAGIEVKGRLDLQPIINAGLEKVANIEAQASRDVADITGKYNVEGIKTRGEFDEKIGKINLAGSMYGLISSAFG